MGHPIFIKKLRHLGGDHLSIVWDGNEGNFFPGLGCWFRSGGLCRWLFWGWSVTHSKYQYTPK